MVDGALDEWSEEATLMTNSERIIDKLRKVMALTKSPEENEASTAIATLQRMLADYNLDIADLEENSGQAKPGVKEQAHDLGKAAFAWKLDLAEAIADHYFCWSMVDRQAKTVQFIGRPDNVESLKMLYSWAIDQIKRISSEQRYVWLERNPGEHMDPLRWQLNFGLGVVSRIRDRLEDLRNRATVNETGLVVSHRTEISDYMEGKYGHRVDGQKTKREQEFDRIWQERQAAKQKLKETDEEAYYNAYPHERPLTTTEQVRRQRELEKWEKKMANRKPRVRHVSQKTYDAMQKREGQAYEANISGRENAARVNLQPFIGTDKPKKEVKG